MQLEQLIKNCIKKDRKAQETLYKNYREKLFPVCLKYCSSYSEAEDHLHDVFIEIFDKISKYANKGSFEGWMKRIAIYKAIDKYKQNKNVSILDTKAASLFENTEISPSDICVSLDILMRFIQELPEQYRIIFNLYELDDYKHKEIAKMLNISEGTSKSNLHRAKALLKYKILENRNAAIKTNNHGR